MEVFQQMKEKIEQDIQAIQDGKISGFLAIEEQDTHVLHVYDDLGNMERRYTITDPDSINKDWLEDRMIVTDSVQETGIMIDTHALASWMDTNIDKNMLITMDYLIFTNDCEQDVDYLMERVPDLEDALLANCLPDDDTIGIMWYMDNALLVSVGGVAHAVGEMVSSYAIDSYEYMDTVNDALLSTLVHEARHLAQANPYLPKELLNQIGDDEQDAETYARHVCENCDLAYIIDISPEYAKIQTDEEQNL